MYIGEKMIITDRIKTKLTREQTAEVPGVSSQTMPKRDNEKAVLYIRKRRQRRRGRPL